MLMACIQATTTFLISSVVTFVVHKYLVHVVKLAINCSYCLDCSPQLIYLMQARDQTLNKHWIYEEYKHRCTPLDSLPKVQSRVNNLAELVYHVHTPSIGVY